MKLREFFAYRKDCPVCKSPLATSFHSQKKQKVRYEDDRYLVLFDLKPIKKQQLSYKVGYSLGLDDNSVYIDFYTKDEVRLDTSPFHLMERFRELDFNLKDYKIYKHCTACRRYNYSTEYLKLNYKNCSMGDITVNSEYIIMVHPSGGDGYKVYKMLNYYNAKETWLNYGKVKTDDIIISPNPDAAMMELPNMLRTCIIPFTSHDETMNRLGKLITFS